jgi:hypothetical protein
MTNLFNISDANILTACLQSNIFTTTTTTTTDNKGKGVPRQAEVAQGVPVG